VTKQHVTVWFTGDLSPVAIANGLDAAAKSVEGAAFIVIRGSQHDCGSDVVTTVLSSFPPHEYTGELKWRIVAPIGALSGEICWPIIRSSRGSLTCDVFFDYLKRRKRSGMTFVDASALVQFVSHLRRCVNGEALLVEPAGLPTPLHDERFERFRRLAGSVPLSSIDWIFGLTNSHAQADGARKLGKSAVAQFSDHGFHITQLFPAPMDYSSATEMAVLRDAERLMGLSDPVPSDPVPSDPSDPVPG
jgi:hypothetical protein